MKRIHLKNGNAELVIDTKGAQVVSYKINGVELMYQGANNPDNSVWKATAKNLFPNPGPVGATQEIPVTKIDENGHKKTIKELIKKLQTAEFDVDGKTETHTIYEYNGSTSFHMGQHGIAHSKTYSVVSKDQKSCVLSFFNEDKNDANFPFIYTYSVLVALEDDGRLTYSTIAQNNDTEPMPGGMGWHPAFALHQNPERYTIVFKNLKAKQHPVRTYTIKKGEEKIKQTEQLIEGKEYSINKNIVQAGLSEQFSGIKSADVVLMYETDNGRKIPYLTMHIKEPIVVLWSKPKKNDTQEDFICIEPWNTTPRQINNLTTQEHTRDLRKNGAIIIEPNQQRYLAAKLTINPEYLKEISMHDNDEVSV